MKIYRWSYEDRLQEGVETKPTTYTRSKVCTTGSVDVVDPNTRGVILRGSVRTYFSQPHIDPSNGEADDGIFLELNLKSIPSKKSAALGFCTRVVALEGGAEVWQVSNVHGVVTCPVSREIVYADPYFSLVMPRGGQVILSFSPIFSKGKERSRLILEGDEGSLLRSLTEFDQRLAGFEG